VRGRSSVLMLGCILLAGLSSAGGAAAAGALPKTHGAVLDSVAGLVAADLLRGATIPAGRAVRFTAPLPGDTLGYLAQHLVEQLRASGTEVRLLARRTPAETAMGEVQCSTLGQETLPPPNTTAPVSPSTPLR